MVIESLVSISKDGLDTGVDPGFTKGGINKEVITYGAHTKNFRSCPLTAVIVTAW